MNLINSTEVYQIERGDYVGIKLNNNILKQKLISQTDTLGCIQSSETERRLIELSSRLSEARANLIFFKSADKESLVEIAAKRVSLYQEQYLNQEKMLFRKEELYRNQLISIEELEEERNTLKNLEIELFNSRAEFERISTGAKPEQIQYLNSVIAGIENEIKVLNNTRKKLNLFSSFNGRIIHPFSEDTLVIIADRKSVVFIPVPVNYLSKIQIDQKIAIMPSLAYEDGKLVTGKISNINQIALQLNQKDVAIVTGEIDSEFIDLPLDMVVTCDILIYEITIREYLFEFFKSVLQAMY